MFEQFVRKIKGKENVDEIFSNDKIPATKAYMVSKYGSDITKEELLKAFFQNARDLIQLKMLKNQYSAVLELNEDIKQYLQQIVDHYRCYGYNVYVIDEETNISNKYNEKSARITLTLVILTWDSPKEAEQYEK